MNRHTVSAPGGLLDPVQQDALHVIALSFFHRAQGAARMRRQVRHRLALTKLDINQLTQLATTVENYLERGPSAGPLARAIPIMPAVRRP